MATLFDDLPEAPPVPAGLFDDIDAPTAAPTGLFDDIPAPAAPAAKSAKRAAMDVEMAKLRREGEAGEAVLRTLGEMEDVAGTLGFNAPSPIPYRAIEKAVEGTASIIAGQPLEIVPTMRPSEWAKTPVMGGVPHIPQQEGPKAQTAAGVGNAAIDFVNFMLTADGVSTLGIGALPKASQQALLRTFAVDLAAHAPQHIARANELAAQGDIQGAVKEATSGGGAALFAAASARHSMAPGVKVPDVEPAGKATIEQPFYAWDALGSLEKAGEELKAQKVVEQVATKAEQSNLPATAEALRTGEAPKGGETSEIKVEEKGTQEVLTPEEPSPIPEAPKQEYIGMGGAVPGEFAKAPKNPTSIKNAQVDVERAERGLPPAMQPARQTFGQVWDEAIATIDRDPGVQDRLIAELKDNARSVSATEDAMLLHRQVDLRNEEAKALRDLAQARDDGRMLDVETESARVEQIKNQLFELFEIDKKVGTEQARGLNFRKAMAYEDFTLAKMELEKRAANEGAPLTDVQRAEIQELHRRIEETQKQYDDYVAKAEADARQRAIDETIAAGPKPDPYILQVAERIVAGLDKRADAARKRLKERMGRTSAGVDPTVLIDLAEIGASHLGRTGLDVAKWSAKMIEDVGEWAREYLDDVFKRSQALIEAEIGQGEGAAGVRKRITKQDKESGDAFATAIKDKLDAGKRDEIGPIVQKLARAFVELGIKDRDALIDAVHAELQKHIPDITRRETMDAISGYGDFKQLTKDEISVQLRDLKGQMQQVAKLEDMQAGEAPKKTGLERRTPSDTERNLIKQVNELKKRGGFTVTDPAKQLKSALDAIKTRLQHQIADLSLQIANRQQTVPVRKSVPLDTEAAALKAQRDALKTQYEEIFGKRELTDAQRLEMATKAVERSIADYEQRLSTGDISPRKPARATPSSPALEALKARREALAEELKELRELAKPKKTPEQIQLQSLKTRLKNETARLSEKLATKDFSTKPKRNVALDAEATKLKFENEKAKRQFREGLMKDRLAKRSTGRKIFDTGIEGINLARALMTSFDLSAVLRQGGFITLAHPIRAAKVFPAMFKALKSERGQHAIEQELLARANYPLYKQAGLYLSEKGSTLSKMEEAYMSRWADKIPGVSHSQRAYTTFLDVLRADSFDAMAESIARKGKLTEAEGKAIANFINVATGRGKIGMKDTAAVGLNTVFFAPKLVASRFQLLGGAIKVLGDTATGFKIRPETARARRLIALEYARTLGGLAVVYALGSMAGAEIETDPRSSDFGKMKFGDTRVDPMMGLSQVTVLLSRLGSGEKTDMRGRTYPIRGDVPFGKDDAKDVTANFLRTKLAPVPSAVLNVATGKNVVGEEVTPLSTLQDLTVPLSLRDIYDVMQEQGIPKGTAIELLNLLGMSVQHYEDR